MSGWFLQEAGLRTLVVERKEICGGGSKAAGAFLSPKISKPSPYKSYLNDAFGYAVNFYDRHFPDLFNRCGLLKFPVDEQDRIRCERYEPHIDLRWRKERGGYLFEDAGLIDPAKLCERLARKPTSIIRIEDGVPFFKEGLWHLGEYRAPRLLLATGSDELPIPLPYLPIKRFGGYRYDLRFATMQKHKHTLFKRCSVSPLWMGRVVVGATFQRGLNQAKLRESARVDGAKLLDCAKEIVQMEAVEILGYEWGYRAASFDLFPFVGEAIDHKATLARYPSLATGAKIPQERFLRYPGLYIHTALGSRGFVFAPYNAKLLRDLIVSQKNVPERLSPARRFLKWSRKIKTARSRPGCL